mgnify:CR=1 FL=1|tara:strand:+ start:596 stop:925 length:330 start_codon:yes stop_codon:yes gene_type:complete
MGLGLTTILSGVSLLQKATGDMSKEMGGGETSAQKRARIESRVDMSDAKRTVYDRVDMKAGKVKASEAVSYKDYQQGWNNFLNNVYMKMATDNMNNPGFVKKRKTVEEV